MVLVRFSFGAFLVLGFTAACSSSSSGGPSDASSDDASTGTPGSDAAPISIMATCGALTAIAGGGGDGGTPTCPSGMTCCTTITLAIPPSASASCVAVGSCSGISNECTSATDCSSGQVCCGGNADAGAMAAATDASTAGGVGGFPAFDPSTFSTTCQASCASMQTQECASDTECPSGQTCQAQAAPGGLGGLGGTFMLPSVCGVPRPDAGAPPGDSGTVPVVDSGSPSDADMTVDAPAGD